MLLTAITMLAEIIAGEIFGSIALLADGWHMGTHVAAFAISIFTYRYAKRHQRDPAFSFGTGKVSVLGGFASAVALGVVALVMVLESINRLYHPQPIHFNEAIAVAILGLIVNLVCAFILQRHHHHNDPHEHHHHYDYNLRAAYLHVIADAMTSLLAIIALFSGKYFGWNRMDPIMGIVGAVVISRWSFNLVKDTKSILLDHCADRNIKTKIKDTIEADSDNRISDIHIWKVGPFHYAAIISLVTHYPKPPEYYKNFLIPFKELSHLTIEVNQCYEEPCLAPVKK